MVCVVWIVVTTEVTGATDGSVVVGTVVSGELASVVAMTLVSEPLAEPCPLAVVEHAATTSATKPHIAQQTDLPGTLLTRTKGLGHTLLSAFFLDIVSSFLIGFAVDENSIGSGCVTH